MSVHHYEEAYINSRWVLRCLRCGDILPLKP